MHFALFSVIFAVVMRDFWKKQPFWPAPMEGVMRPAVIQACNDLQLTAGWVTPFFRVSEGVPKMSELKKFIAPFLAPNVKVVLQIMGNDPAKLAETARRGMAAGADGIDLNCGCPSAQVVRHGAGAACMQNMDNTARIIEAVRRAVPESFFSVKTRLGFKDRAESAVFLPLAIIICATV